MRKGMKDARAKVHKALLASPGLKGKQSARDVSDTKVSLQRRQVAKSGYEAPEHRLQSEKLQYLQTQAEERVPELIKNSIERAPELRTLNFEKALARQTKADAEQEIRNAIKRDKQIEESDRRENLYAMREHDKPGMGKKSFKKEIEATEGGAAIKAVEDEKALKAAKKSSMKKE